MKADLDILVDDPRWGAEEALEPLVLRAAEAGLAAAQVETVATICILFADNARIRALNAEFRGKDKATNVLSFPSDAPVPPGQRAPLGDIALAFETVAAEAQDSAKSLEAHLKHLIIHAVLHLLGYDHETDADADEMERIEVAALASLGIANPYLVTGTETDTEERP